MSISLISVPLREYFYLFRHQSNTDISFNDLPQSRFSRNQQLLIDTLDEVEDVSFRGERYVKSAPFLRFLRHTSFAQLAARFDCVSGGSGDGFAVSSRRNRRERNTAEIRRIPEFHWCAYALETVLSFAVNAAKKGA